MTTLTYSGTTLALPADLQWTDEYAWQPVEQRTRYTIFGAMRVEAAAKLAGRPITLAGGRNYAWIPRTTLETLRDWTALPAQTFALVYRGQAHTVVFDQARGPLQAEPILDYAEPAGGDFYVTTLRFLKV
jgi:hypothetical protein